MKSGVLENQSKKGQVWIETVIYTSIALLMIGFVLTYAKPEIEKLQDKAILEQSLEMFRTVDNTIKTIGVAGNKRFVETGIKKGSLKIDGENDKIVFEMESIYVYSQPGEDITDTIGGRIVKRTEKIGSLNKISFTIDYSVENINITYNENDEFKTLNKAPAPYNLLISNNGRIDGNTLIDISLRG